MSKKKSRIAERRSTAAFNKSAERNTHFVEELNDYEKLYERMFGDMPKYSYIPFQSGMELMRCIYQGIKILGDDEGAEYFKNSVLMWLNRLPIEFDNVGIQIALPNSKKGKAIGLTTMVKDNEVYMVISVFETYKDMARAAINSKRIDLYEGNSLRTVFSKIA